MSTTSYVRRASRVLSFLAVGARLAAGCRDQSAGNGIPSATLRVRVTAGSASSQTDASAVDAGDAAQSKPGSTQSSTMIVK